MLIPREEYLVDHEAGRSAYTKGYRLCLVRRPRGVNNVDQCNACGGVFDINAIPPTESWAEAGRKSLTLSFIAVRAPVTLYSAHPIHSF